MTEKMIIDAYIRIRTIDQTIPDDVLDFMKDSAIEKLKSIMGNVALSVCPKCLINERQHGVKYCSSCIESMKQFIVTKNY